MGAPAWSEYLSGFHAVRPGITEQVLLRARDGRIDAYGWLARAVPEGGLVLDLACGNGALRPYLDGAGYLGVDLSAEELIGARQRGVGRLVRARADALPLPAASVQAVVCSMGLHVLTPLPAVLAEVGRVLVPGGPFVFSVPDRNPLRLPDVPAVAGLLVALGRRLRYPNDRMLGRLPALLGAAGLRLDADQRRRFGYPLDGKAAADRLLRSLYLPGVSARRYRAAGALLCGYAKLGVNFPLPVRRVIATRM